MPRWRAALAAWPHAVLRASEDAVGLPAGQMGNSEVGHLNLGAGRPVLQDLPRIDAAIDDGSFFARPALVAACERARETGRLHAVGLIGPGGVHAHDRHLLALVELAARLGVPSVRVHALLDGRDTPPSSALGYMRDLEARLAVAHPDARVASVGGRYYAMDRDKRWERTERGYDAIVHAEGFAPRPRRRRSRMATPAARRTSSSPRPSSTARTARCATATRSSTSTSAPTARASSRTRSRRPLHGLRPHQPGGSPGADGPARGHDERVRGRPARRGGVRARGGPLARPGVQRGRLAPAPRRRDGEVRARHVLLQRRRREGLARRGADARPVPQGRHVRPAARDERRGRRQRARRGDRVGALRLHRGELRQPGHGGAHRASGTRR